MILILWFSLALAAVYLLYPAVLLLLKPLEKVKSDPACAPDRVTLVLLVYNGMPNITEKIPFLLKELEAFPEGELIIIDDCSTDGSVEMIRRFREIPGVKIIEKTNRTGIAGSMNSAVQEARYDIVVFCDQRQKLSQGSLRRILKPLSDPRVGAVSGYLSHMDKGNKDSILRRHENFLKEAESRSGSLIGVYGPFYAIRKNCFTEIPAGIILDDLWLSLSILGSKRIVLERDCIITDDDHAMLYDYARTRRYLLGLLQILVDRKTLHGLAPRYRLMLLWHKYLRLLIPVSLFASYVATGVLAIHNLVFLVAFLVLTLLPGVFFLPSFTQWNARLGNLFRMNVFYLLAFTDIFYRYVRTWGKP